MKKSFVLYVDTLSIIEKLSNSQAGALLKGMYSYHKTGDVPTIDPTLDLVFHSFLVQFERDSAKYDERCERNKKNGRQGGRPKVAENQQFTEIEQNPQKPTGFSGLPKNPVGADNDNDSDNDSDNDKSTIVVKKKEKKEVWKPTRESIAKIVFQLGFLGVYGENAVDAFVKWIDYKKTETKEKGYKSETTFTTVAKAAFRDAQACGQTVPYLVDYAISKGWKGIYPVKDQITPTAPQNGLNLGNQTKRLTTEEKIEQQRAKLFGEPPPETTTDLDEEFFQIMKQ